MSRVMPAAAATSSMEVLEKPPWPKATAAALRMAALRAGRARSRRGPVPCSTWAAPAASLAGCIQRSIQFARQAVRGSARGGRVTTLQTEWTEQELLASHPVEEPLIAGGVRCHGGFDQDGGYVSPRTLNRWPAIDAWKQQRAEQFGTPLLDVDLAAWPGTYPNAAQAKHLIASGVPEPIISTLTRIGTVEGFGAMIRYSVLPDFQSCFEEDTRGTAMAHLAGGLFEAHARDEAGWGEEGGHKQMWEAARDLALSSPKVPGDILMAIMGRRGNNGGRGRRALPQLNEDVERVIGFMMN